MKTLKLALITLIMTLTTLAFAQEKQPEAVSANGVEISIEVVDDAGVAVGHILGGGKPGQPPILAACCVQPEKQAFTAELIRKIQSIANLTVNSLGVCHKETFNRRLSVLLAAEMKLPADAVKDGKSTLQIRHSDITQDKILACLGN